MERDTWMDGEEIWMKVERRRPLQLRLGFQGGRGAGLDSLDLIRIAMPGERWRRSGGGEAGNGGEGMRMPQSTAQHTASGFPFAAPAASFGL